MRASWRPMETKVFLATLDNRQERLTAPLNRQFISLEMRTDDRTVYCTAVTNKSGYLHQHGLPACFEPTIYFEMKILMSNDSKKTMIHNMQLR